MQCVGHRPTKPSKICGNDHDTLKTMKNKLRANMHCVEHQPTNRAKNVKSVMTHWKQEKQEKQVPRKNAKRGPPIDTPVGKNRKVVMTPRNQEKTRKISLVQAFNAWGTGQPTPHKNAETIMAQWKQEKTRKRKFRTTMHCVEHQPTNRAKT